MRIRDKKKAALAALKLLLLKMGSPSPTVSGGHFTNGSSTDHANHVLHVRGNTYCTPLRRGNPG